MSTIFTVNDWVVEDINGRIEIFNRSHIEWSNSYNVESGRYRFRERRVPKSVDRAIKRYLNIRQTSAEERTFGIEIECYHPSNCDIREVVSRTLTSRGIGCQYMGYTHTLTNTWKVVTDSSIRGGYGLEVVSPVLKGQTGIDNVKQVMKILSELGCRVNKSTGMHVHIGANDLSSTNLHKCFEFYKLNESLFDGLVSESRRRNNNQYCRSLQEFTTFATTRYVKLNYQSYVKYGTIEFRQHQGSLNGDKAEHWIKLVRSVIAFCAQGNSIRRYHDLESMLMDLGLSQEAGWYLERVEELA